MAKQSQNPSTQLRERSRGQLIMLTAMFVLGMAVNLLGLPEEADGTAKVISGLSLGLHGFIGIGLVVGSILAVLYAAKISQKLQQLAWMGLVAIVITFVCGVLTFVLDNDWYSYAMALGFLVSFWLYGMLYVKSTSVAT